MEQEKNLEESSERVICEEWKAGGYIWKYAE